MILDSITWTASPELFSAGGITVRWYGLMFAIGFLVGYEIVAASSATRALARVG